MKDGVQRSGLGGEGDPRKANIARRERVQSLIHSMGGLAVPPMERFDRSQQPDVSTREGQLDASRRLEGLPPRGMRQALPASSLAERIISESL